MVNKIKKAIIQANSALVQNSENVKINIDNKDPAKMRE